MSAATRTEISDAASTVEGVSCTPYFRQTTTPGHSMVTLARRVRASNGFGFVDTWHLLMVLPAAVDAGEKYFEDKAPALVDALDPVAQVQSLTPQDLILSDGKKLPCVVIELVRASD